MSGLRSLGLEIRSPRLSLPNDDPCLFSSRPAFSRPHQRSFPLPPSLSPSLPPPSLLSLQFRWYNKLVHMPGNMDVPTSDEVKVESGQKRGAEGAKAKTEGGGEEGTEGPASLVDREAGVNPSLPAPPATSFLASSRLFRPVPPTALPLPKSSCPESLPSRAALDAFILPTASSSSPSSSSLSSPFSSSSSSSSPSSSSPYPDWSDQCRFTPTPPGAPPGARLVGNSCLRRRRSPSPSRPRPCSSFPS